MASFMPTTFCVHQEFPTLPRSISFDSFIEAGLIMLTSSQHQAPSNQKQEISPNPSLVEPTPLHDTKCERVEQINLDDFPFYYRSSHTNIDAFRSLLSPLIGTTNEQSLRHADHGGQHDDIQDNVFKQQRTPAPSHRLHPSQLTQERRRIQSKGKRRGICQAERWEQHFIHLLGFRAMYGHCSVPSAYKQSPVLARWVKRQRYFYHEKKAGARNSLTDEREHRLQEAGFVWDTQQAAWDKHFDELALFYAEHGHCSVNETTAPGQLSLASWVKWQRRHYRADKVSLKGGSVGISASRIAKLNSINFDWNPRQRQQEQQAGVAELFDLQRTAGAARVNYY